MGLIQTNTHTLLFLLCCSAFLTGYAQNCQHFSCAECTQSNECGWCGSEPSCRPGSEIGPTDGQCSNWLFSDCPELPTCGTIRDCSSCVERSYCGWCQNSCFNGDELGPAASLLNCTGSDWEFFSCKGQSCDAARSCSECVSTGCVWNLETASGSEGCAEMAPTGEESWVSTCPAIVSGIESITFDTNRVQLHVVFTVATDEGVNAETSLQRYSCSTYFLEEAEFGEDPLCYWNSPWELIVRLSEGPTLTFGSVLTLVPGVIRELHTLNPIDDFAAIRKTDSPVAAAIAGPVRVSDCASQIVQYSAQSVVGSGPDGFTLSWDASIPHSVQMDGELLVIEGGPVEQASFTVSLTMTNFLGESDSVVLQVDVVAGGEIPLLGLFGPTQVSSGESFVLAGNITDSTGPCFPTTNLTDVVLTWQVEGLAPCAAGMATSPEITSSTWLVPNTHFPSGCRYQVTLRALKGQDNFGSASTVISVVDTLSVSIASGTSRVVGQQTLMSNAIVNQDVAQTSFEWTCRSLTTTDSCSVVGSSALEPTLELDTTQMMAGVYQITVQATFNEQVQVARQLIRVTEASGSAVVLETMSSDILEALITKNSVPLSASHTSSGTFQWSVSTPYAAADAASFEGSTEESCATLTPAGPVTAVTEVFVTVTGTDNGVVTSATSRITFASDPYNGVADFFTKLGGFAYVSPNFLLRVPSWASASTPLLYAIVYDRPLGGKRLLTPPQPFNRIEFRIPIGNVDDDELLGIQARVFNAEGAFVDLGTKLRGFAPVDSVTVPFVQESLTEYAQAAVISGDSSTLLSSVTLRSDALNNLNVPALAFQTLADFASIDISTHQILRQWSSDMLMDLADHLAVNPPDSIKALAALSESDSMGQFNDIVFSSFGNVLGATSIPSESVQLGIDAVLKNLVIGQTANCLSSSTSPQPLIHPNLNATIIETPVPITTPNYEESFGDLTITIPQAVFDTFVPEHEVVWIAGLVYTSSPFPAANVRQLANQVSISLYDNNGNNLAVTDAPENILFDFGVSADQMLGADEEIKCQFYDRTTMLWAEDGCTTEERNGNIICACNHLTEIGVNAVSPPVPMPPTIPPTLGPTDTPTEAVPTEPSAPTVQPTANATMIPEEGDDTSTVEIIALILLGIMCLLIFIILIGLIFLYCKVRRFKKRTAKPIDDHTQESNTLLGVKQQQPTVQEDGPIKIAQSSDSRIVKPVFNTNDESSTDDQSFTRTSSQSQSRPSDSYRTTTSDEDVSQYSESYPRSSSDFSDFVESDSSPSWSRTSGIESGGKPRTRYSDESEAYFTPGFDGSSEGSYTLSGMSGLSFSSQSNPTSSSAIDSMVDHTADYFPDDVESGSSAARLGANASKARGDTKGSTDDNPFQTKYRKEGEPLASSSTSRKQFADGLPNEKDERSTDDDSMSDTVSSSRSPQSDSMSRGESSEFSDSSIDEISSFTSSGGERPQVPATIVTPPPGDNSDYDSYTDSGTSSDQVSSEDLEEYSTDNSESPSGSYSNSTNDRQTASDEYSYSD